MIETQLEYIKKHVVKNERKVVIEIIVEEDYDPRTDGFYCHLVSFESHLSMPQDNSGDSDIDCIMLYLNEAIECDKLQPGTVYRVTMIECAEHDGSPVLMPTWAVMKVTMEPFS